MTTREDLAPDRGTPRAAAGDPQRPTLVHRHPRLTFAVIAVGLTWAVQLTFLALGWPLFPALAIELVILAVTASVITGLTEGKAGVRRLFAGVLRWRFGVRWWAAVLTVVPVATVAVAGVVGTLQGPDDGWGAEVFQYLFLTLVFGALLGNMWEELGWTGFFQAEMTDRHGLLEGALITAVPFGLIHLPLAFEADGLGGTSLRDVALTWSLLLVVAPFFRYLIGLTYQRTGRSLVAVAVLHGSFNAAGAMTLATGGWEYIAGAVLVTPVVTWVATRSGRQTAWLRA
ncbi:MAG TPA: CPBP family intramembrane glutamic endopeptidase [Actinoplanes sp.]|nr:CPBP family intramembrane glutamic endopeptidase [Actinoplanes sp.]